MTLNSTPLSEKINSFAPLIGNAPTVLILGTIPGKESLRLHQYYGHPRNVFWKIMYQLFQHEFETDYNIRTHFLKERGIAVWDVCHSANRKSSLDVDLKNELPNEIMILIASNPTVKTIAFNGQKAEKFYSTYFDKLNNLNYLTLLSTSPTNAAYSFEKKLKDWERIRS